MSVPRNFLQRREFPPKGPEHKILRDIASNLLILDFSALRILQKHEKSIDYQKAFVDLTVDILANINHDNQFESISRTIRRHVRTLSEKNLYEIVSKPFKSDFYRQMIYLWIEAYDVALKYDQDNQIDVLIFDPPSITVEAAQEELRHILSISQSLYKHVENAAANGYLQKFIAALKEGVQSIDENIEDLCSTLIIQHEPLIYLDDADERKLPNRPSSNPPNATIEQEKARSALAFIVPVTCAISFIPACFASVYSENKPGKIKDSDFFQLIASGLIQLLGIFTAFWPIYKKLRPDRVAWIQSCTLAVISFFLTVAAFPVYLRASTTWGGLTLLAGSFVQSFLQLQLFLGIPREKVHED